MGNATVILTGNIIETNQEIADLAPGWNLTAIRQIQPLDVSTDDVLGRIWGWDNKNQHFERVDGNLFPGQAYWIYSGGK